MISYDHDYGPTNINLTTFLKKHYLYNITFAIITALPAFRDHTEYEIDNNVRFIKKYVICQKSDQLAVAKKFTDP